MGSASQKVVIVGGVAAGMSAATRLRRNDEKAQIIVFERGPYVSFANCGLPYHVSGVIPERDELLLQTPQDLADRFNIEVRVGHSVTAVDPASKTVSVEGPSGQGFDCEYDSLVLATGAKPVVPSIPGIERAHTLRDVPDLDRIMQVVAARMEPGNAVIIGAGFIGLEVAENLRHLKWNVTVVELGTQVLAPLDSEMAAAVDQHLQSHGVFIKTRASVERIDETEVHLDDGTLLPADLVISAIGVTPESALARAAGLQVHENGGIVVDEMQRTSEPSIFAVGDVAQKRHAISDDAVLVPLAQTANRHGRLVADVICGRATAAKPVIGTAIVGLFGLTAAVAGWSEKTARRHGRDVRVIHTHPSHHAGYYPGAEGMALKLVVDAATDQILGVQGVGKAGVDKRIDVIATAMRAGLTGSDLADLELAYAPQFGSAKDPVNMLGMIADNLATGVLVTAQWHEVAKLSDSGWTVLDVRTRAESAAAPFPGALNIPVDELRDRRHELPNSPLVVTCAVGVRGNVATRMLTSLGHTAVNLDGGYRTWQAGTEAAVHLT